MAHARLVALTATLAWLGSEVMDVVSAHGMAAGGACQAMCVMHCTA